MAGVPEVIKGAFKYSLAGTTLTISAIGVTKVRFPKQGTPGDFVTLDLTGKSYTFDPAAYPDSMGCGITATVSWGSAGAFVMPWHDYLVNIDNTAAGVIAATSRHPHKTTISAHANVSFSDALLSGTPAQGDTVAWAVHAAGTGGQPCVWIGSHRQYYTYGGVGSREWTVDALATTDGFGMSNENTLFSMAAGQNGARASHFTGANGPYGNADIINWKLSKSGLLWLSVSIGGALTNGGDGALTYVYAPMTPAALCWSAGQVAYGGAVPRASVCLLAQATYGAIWRLCSDDVVPVNNGFSNAADTIAGTFTYQIL